MELHEQRTASEFISIRETVELVAEKRDVDIEAVAGYIHRLLIENCSTGERPRFFAMDRIKQCLIESNDDFVVGRLREIERTGLFLDIRTGDGRRYCSDYGFLRHEISKYLGIPTLLANQKNNFVVEKASETPEQRRARIVRTVDENKAKKIPKTKSFADIGASEIPPCSGFNIRRIYRGY